MRFKQRVSSRGAVAGGWRRRAIRVVTILLIVLMCGDSSSAYSVLTHEEIVDLLWSDAIQPLLLQRFPALSADQIREAHTYAYGGAVIKDLGYYPFGNREFSNLAHYVRSGDAVRELLLESQDVNECAFALGARRNSTEHNPSPSATRAGDPGVVVGTLKKLCARVLALRPLANLYVYKCEFAHIRNRPRNLGRDLEVRRSTLPGSPPNIPSNEYGRCLGI
jgi:hypothetical protein